MDVGLLYRKSETAEIVKKSIASPLDFKQFSINAHNCPLLSWRKIYGGSERDGKHAVDR